MGLVMNSVQRMTEDPTQASERTRTKAPSDLGLPADSVEVVPVCALLLGERLDTRALERNTPLGAAPLPLDIPGDAVAVLFRYGAVVLFGAATAAIDNCI